ncbi:hypothetical protein Pcinc_000185 [Petrolisthes cinctipes]|uniref:Uncharacterized protein n=1 Tax=Petrolisthes cinctipes TaxID=88211 RepID=A0AAE1L4M0_PETCI|nr:hypothetical protein Pcinc_000185 [Petrolisthes cinctipes]
MEESAGDHVTIQYPPGCWELTEHLESLQLIRRLKKLCRTFQSMDQDCETYQEYIPLAMYIAEDYFLYYPSRDVQILIACCIADVLRLNAPDAPYKDPAQIKTVFMFMIKQLGGLKDPNDPAFKYYYYLLEKLAYARSFNLCFELEDCQEIFYKLFKLVFNIVNGKVKSYMLDLLCPLISENDEVSNDLLDIILSSLLEPAKSQRPMTYALAKELIVICSNTLEPYIQKFDHMLKSADEEERYGAVSLLARMFSEDFTFALCNKLLWITFLFRFNDISIRIRTKCVKYSKHFLLAHPLLRKNITDAFKMRQYDSEEIVRYEVVMAIVSAAKEDFSILSESKDLLNFVTDRTRDTKFKIRRQAMYGLAMIYKKYLNSQDVPAATRRAVAGIKDKILHDYHLTNMDDKLMVERLLNTYLVPYQLSPEDRMKKLFYLFATIDDKATKAFIELQKHQLVLRKIVAELIELHHRPQNEERDQEIAYRLSHLTKYLPDPLNIHKFLRKFSQHLHTDSQLLTLMETIVSPDVSCKDSVDAVTQILKKLGQPVITNRYYVTIKGLLERVSTVMVDQTALEALMGLIKGSLANDEDVLTSLNLTLDIATEKGIQLLSIFSLVYPAYFLHPFVLRILTSLLTVSSTADVSPALLSVLTCVGKYKPIGEVYPDLASVLIPICQRFAEYGSPKQAKHAIRCLHANCTSDSDDVFKRILEKVGEQLTFDSENFKTSLTTIGHIAFNMPEKFLAPIKIIVANKVVLELLMQNQTATHTPGPNQCQDVDEWVEEDDLTEETVVKMEGIKMLANWLLGLKSNIILARKTFRLLHTFILHQGDLLKTGNMLKGEMAQMRLSAGCAMLKICKQKGVGDQFTTEQFYNLSLLMNDECPQVREHFAIKLHKGLAQGIPDKCLPIDFMGFYALAGLESDRQLKLSVRKYMITDITRRRDYIRYITTSGESDKASNQLDHIMPDYMLVFAVPILIHMPDFKDPSDKAQLERIRSCLWFILEPLMNDSDAYCFGFYKAFLTEMVNHKYAVKPKDKITNQKLWAVCNVAMGLILSKTPSLEIKEYPSEPKIPSKYFKKHEDPSIVNVNSGLLPEIQVTTPKGFTQSFVTDVAKAPRTTVVTKTRAEQSEDSLMDDETITNLSNARKKGCTVHFLEPKTKMRKAD